MENVLQELNNQVDYLGLERDKEYYNFHKNRFKRVHGFLKNQKGNKPQRVLDIGSHYLHTSILAKQIGYEVDSMDVSDFWELDFVKNRAANYGLNPIIENDLGTIASLDDKEDYYDIILFTEILEHITFNPIYFWKQVYKSLKSGGIIYISTPNSLSLPGIAIGMKNLFTLRGIGISVPRIFDCVTYGHHWKEYSGSEIKRYFKFLSDDFDIKVEKYYYKNYSLKGPGLIYNLLARIGNSTGFFAEDLEAIVRVNKVNGWKKELPKY
ncbi:class I SAM-dependent methyltransferase [Echinicola shivajiensis]|uniref:class I SAM-dependent methyltransferase n=1 Tax=Echinicola shivajiensis TaxID=1035916 RepID=UPI001BFCA0AA|nr:methyltransferase domain-containing protein [Echinicola shivajiensis]